MCKNTLKQTNPAWNTWTVLSCLHVIRVFLEFQMLLERCKLYVSRMKRMCSLFVHKCCVWLVGYVGTHVFELKPLVWNMNTIYEVNCVFLAFKKLTQIPNATKKTYATRIIDFTNNEMMCVTCENKEYEIWICVCHRCITPSWWQMYRMWHSSECPSHPNVYCPPSMHESVLHTELFSWDNILTIKCVASAESGAGLQAETWGKSLKYLLSHYHNPTGLSNLKEARVSSECNGSETVKIIIWIQTAQSSPFRTFPCIYTPSVLYVCIQWATAFSTLEKPASVLAFFSANNNVSRSKIYCTHRRV